MAPNQDNIVVNTGYLKALRALSIVEGVSTLLLFFVAMPLKYAASMPIAVTIVGSVHGVLFTLLVAAFALGHQLVPLPAKLAWLGIGAAIIPFGPFMLEPRLRALGQGNKPGDRTPRAGPQPPDFLVCQRRGGRNSNPQPPDRQSGTPSAEG